MSDSLRALGWGAHFEEAFAAHAGDGLVPARVAVQHRGAYVVWSEHGELSAELTGRLRYDAVSAAELPAAGDWVAVRPLDDGQALIHAVLPRQTAVSRKTAFRATEEQVLAANVDVVFILTGLDRDFSVRRVERYLATVWESGAQPVVVLSKADLCDDLASAHLEVELVAPGVSIHVVSALTGDGVDDLRVYLEGHRTVTLVGSSGVGKSTLINALGAAELQKTGELRRAGRGRHTTTTRELIVLPGGGLVLDTPGIRELQLWEVGEGMGTAFGDVEGLFAECRFADCSHEREPGCAVRRALAAGTLDRERWASYRKLQRELQGLEIRHDKRLRSEARKTWRKRERARRHPKRW